MTDGLKKVSGQVQTIDTAKRALTILSYEEMDGKKCPITTALKWTPGLDGKMGKLKEKFFQTFLYQGEQIDDAHYFAKPADWPQQQHENKGGQNWQPRKPRVTIAATINLQNYENIKVEVEANSAEESTKILIDTLKGFATNPNYKATREMIDSYLARVLNQGGQ